MPRARRDIQKTTAVSNGFFGARRNYYRAVREKSFGSLVARSFRVTSDDSFSDALTVLRFRLMIFSMTENVTAVNFAYGV